MALIDLIEMVVDLASCGAEVLPGREKPKDPFLRLFLYALAAALLIAAICVVAQYFDWL